MHRRTVVTTATTALLILCLTFASGLMTVSPAYADGSTVEPPVIIPPPPKSPTVGDQDTALSVDSTWMVIGGVLQVVLLIY